MSKKSKAAKKSKSAAKKSSVKSKAAPRRTGRAALSVATSSARSVADRVEALYDVPIAEADNERGLQSVLKVLRNKAEPIEVRLTALQTLQAATFSAPDYESWRADYIAALREVAMDPDAELRQRALGILSREKDGFAQKKLLEGLEKPEKALVPPEKALQLLGNDVHAEAYAAARDIIKNPPNTAAKREALRLLAADAGSAPILEKVLRDKGETLEVRQVSAAALHALRPDKLQQAAREILLDQSEPDEMRTASLMAMTQFGDEDQVTQDKELLKQVEKLSSKASAKVKQSARKFLDKYRS